MNGTSQAKGAAAHGAFASLIVAVVQLLAVVVIGLVLADEALEPGAARGRSLRTIRPRPGPEPAVEAAPAVTGRTRMHRPRSSVSARAAGPSRPCARRIDGSANHRDRALPALACSRR